MVGVTTGLLTLSRERRKVEEVTLDLPSGGDPRLEIWVCKVVADY